MSIRGGWGRFYERMSNQLWDSEYTNLPISRSPRRRPSIRSAAVRDRPPARTILQLPAPGGFDGRHSTGRRSRERPREG